MKNVMKKILVLPVILVLFILASCSRAVFDQVPPTVVGLEVSPADVTSPTHSVQAFKVTALYSDGTKGNVTDKATFDIPQESASVGELVSGGSTAEDTAPGLVQLNSPGVMQVSAVFNDIEASAKITVFEVKLVSISLDVESTTLPKGISKQITATGVYEDGTTTDLTSLAVWSVDNAAIVLVHNAMGSKGQIWGNTTGTTNVSVTYNNVQAHVAITITPAVLTSVALTPATGTIAKGLSQQFVATGTYSDNTTLNISNIANWTSSDATIATVNGTGNASSLLVGNANVQASLSGISAQANLSVTAAQLVSIAVQSARSSLAKGLSDNLTAIGTYTDGSTLNLTSQVIWASSASTVASISNASGSEGRIATLQVGSTIISATQGSIVGNLSFAVNAAELVSVSLNSNTVSGAIGFVSSFRAFGHYTDASVADVTSLSGWTSSDATIATVGNAGGAKGQASALAVGTTQITATLQGFSDQAAFQVTAATLQSLSITATAATFAKGVVSQLHAVGTFSNAATQDLTDSVTWSSNTPLTLSVSNASGQAGKIQGLTIGSAQITATSGGVNNQVTVGVTAAEVTALTVSPLNASVALGLNQQYAAQGLYTDMTTSDLTSLVTWSVANSKAAISNTIGSKGLLNTILVGTTQVSASYSGLTGNTDLTVAPASLVWIAIQYSTSPLPKGLTSQATAIGNYTDGSTQNLTNTVTWSSSDASLVSVSTVGLLTGLNQGTTQINASLSGVVSHSAFTIAAPVLSSITVACAQTSLALGLGADCTATGNMSDATTQNLSNTATWSSSASAVASVSSAGHLTSVAVGSTNISAVSAGVSSNVVAVSVTPAALVSIQASLSAASVAKGLTLTATAIGTYTNATTANITNSVIWTSSNAAAATVNSAGLVQSVAVGTANIIATQGLISNQVAFAVTVPQLVSIAVNFGSTSIAKGLTTQATAVGTYTDGSTQDLSNTVTWASTNVAAATVGSSGLITSVAAGTSSISASLSGVTSQATITVTAAQLVSMQVALASASVAKGLNTQATATGVYTDASTQDLSSSATWSSSSTANATVNSSGLVHTVAAGAATITATVGAVNAHAALTVLAPQLASIQVTLASASVAKGLTTQATATGTYTDATTANITNSVSWSSAQVGVATVSSSGLLSTPATGTSVITATMGSINGAATLTVTAAQLVSLQVSLASSSVAKGLTTQATATGTYTDATTANITNSVTGLRAQVVLQV